MYCISVVVVTVSDILDNTTGNLFSSMIALIVGMVSWYTFNGVLLSIEAETSTELPSISSFCVDGWYSMIID